MMDRRRLFAFVAGAFLVVVTPAAAVAQAPAQAAIESRFADVNGTRLHYLIAGQGGPVILLHGYPQTSHMWRPLIAELAKTHTVVAPYLRGAGRSAKPETGYDKKTMAQDIRELARSLGLGRVKVAGHDIGAMVAYAYAAQYPDEVYRIALLDGYLPGIGDWHFAWLSPALWHHHFTDATALKLVAGREAVYFEHFWNDFAVNKDRTVPEADRRLYAEAYAQPGGMRAGFEYFRAFEQDAEDFKAFARSRLDTPMMVFAGQTPAGDFLAYQSRLVAVNVEVLTFDGAGHWLMEEAPEKLIPQIESFFGGPD